MDIRKWVGEAWLFERVINEPSTATSSWHLLIDADSYYVYRVRSVCGSDYSSYTVWSRCLPGLGGSSGPGGQVGPPESEAVPVQGQSYAAPGRARERFLRFLW